MKARCFLFGALIGARVVVFVLDVNAIVGAAIIVAGARVFVSIADEEDRRKRSG